jgi:hypothetical protein
LDDCLVDSQELSIFETTFLGKTYKHSYTLNFKKIGSNKTEIVVHVKLYAVQVGFFSREENLENVENYLRQKLLNKISDGLKA